MSAAVSRLPGSEGAPFDMVDMVDRAMPTSGDMAVPKRQECDGLQAKAPWPMFGRCSFHQSRSKAFGPQSAKVRWTIARKMGCASVGAGGTVYVGSEDGFIYALDGATGARRWVFTTGGWVLSSPAIGDDGTVYVGSADHNVYAIDGATGVQRWKAAVGFGQIVSSPAIGADGTVYISSGDPLFYALDGATGVEKWGILFAGYTNYGVPIGADGTLYVGFQSNFQALDGTTGKQKWSLPIGSNMRSNPAIGADGTVYFAGADGNFYAIGP